MRPSLRATLFITLLTWACDPGRRPLPVASGGDAGGRELDGAGNTTAWHDFGSGEYGIHLSDRDPPRFCWHIEETVRITASGRRDWSSNLCTDGLDDAACLAAEPIGSLTDTNTLYERVDYQTVSRGALYGTCAQLDAYWESDPSTQCLFHKHCGGGRECFDYQCLCPEGAQCACATACSPQPSRCDGDVQVDQVPTDMCDALDRCTYREARTTCGGGGCDARRGACVMGTPGPRPGGEMDAGSSADSAMPGPAPDGSTLDAGSPGGPGQPDASAPAPGQPDASAPAPDASTPTPRPDAAAPAPDASNPPPPRPDAGSGGPCPPGGC